MHPGGDSEPGDPNAAFFLDGVCHLHYIINHPFDKGKHSWSFVHVSSNDMLHWTRHKTRHKTSLQPSFTGHGMFSGTGFITREGRRSPSEGSAFGRSVDSLSTSSLIALRSNTFRSFADTEIANGRSTQPLFVGLKNTS